jgi:hypothetical protein
MADLEWFVTDSVYAVAIHPENPILIASGGGDDRCYLWRADTGEKIFELTSNLF